MRRSDTTRRTLGATVTGHRMQPHPLTHLRHTHPSRYTNRYLFARLLIVTLVFALLTSCVVGADDSTSGATPPVDGTEPHRQ